MADDSTTNDERLEEDPASEARRFSALLSLLHENFPELRAWKLEDAFDDEVDSETLGLGEAWVLVNEHLFDDGYHPVDVDGAWPRLLAVIEVALEVCDLLYDDERDDDGTTLDAFAGAGIMCDITRNVSSLEVLLPWMGPRCLESASAEVAVHTTSRSYTSGDVNWETGGVRYQSLTVSPPDFLPERRS